MLSSGVLGNVLDHAWHLKKEGYRESTITARVKALKGLARKTDLFDSESVKGTIALLECSEARKEVLVCVYEGFSRQYNIPFNPPKYRRIEKLPFIPLESEIDQLIAGMGRRHATFLQTLKETGARPGEVWGLKWDELDMEGRTVNIVPKKGSAPRQLRPSPKLLAMLNALPRKNNQVFGGGSMDDFARWFYMRRQEIAEKLGTHASGRSASRPSDTGKLARCTDRPETFY